MTSFVGGIELSRRFFEEVVRPRADRLLGPDRYAAALVGPGSEVLGLDTERSTDHDWGPRVLVLVGAADQGRAGALREDLPPSFDGHPLAFGAAHGGSPWIHPVDVATVERFFRAWIGCDPRAGMTTLDWLAAPTNGLLMLTAGAVHHDGPGELTAARRAVSWYPDEVWIWLLGCQWRRVAEEEPFVGRAHELGDDLAGRLLAARLVRDAVRLAHLLERRYAPYGKWLVAGLDRLACGATLRPLLSAAAVTGDGAERRRTLAEAFGFLGEATNRLGLVPPVDTSPRAFHSRPYVVGPAADLSAALLEATTDPVLRGLRPHGAVDQLFDSTHGDHHVARRLYASLLGAAR